MIALSFSVAGRSDTLKIKRNVAFMASGSILDGGGYRFSLPGFYYGSRTHAFSFAPSAKVNDVDPFVFGLSASYYFFIEPSFRDISFFLQYNAAFFFEKKGTLTHIFGIGTQIDIGKRCFIQHSVGFGVRQYMADFSSSAAGQLKLSFGFYLREIPVIHIHDNWEK
jgi:hypothetical protein